MKRTTLCLLAIGLFFSLTSEKCKEAGSGASGTESLPSGSISLFGTRWNLASVAGEAIKLPEGTENPYISVAEDMSLTGFSGCNRLMGSAKMEEGALSFPGVGSTKMYCKETQAVESSFLNALRATNSFKLEHGKLTLLDKSKELATLVSAK